MKAIQATPESIERVLRGYRFIIPDFQRPYAWGVDQCDQLLDDISSFCDNAKTNDQYFLGSIVVYPDNRKRDTLNVIDGQQRLTTLIILIKVLFEIDASNSRLEEYLHPLHPSKIGALLTDELRLTSKVLAGEERDDYNDFKCVITGEGNYTDNSNFSANYYYLQRKISEWHRGKSAKKWKKLVNIFQTQVVLLQLRCDSANDALDLFQIINDRGLALDDADIFKVKIYSAIRNKEERKEFIARWGSLEGHYNLFKIFTHISRADRQDLSKEKQLRRYISDNHMSDASALEGKWKSLMRSLEICYWLGWQVENLCSDENEKSDETIYWKILRCCPNDYWQYPIYVFVHKHAKDNKGKFILPKNKRKEYLALLKNTVRYFFIKSVVYKTINSVKSTTYRVCARIAAGENYTNVYKNDVDNNDIDVLSQKLDNSDYGKNLTGLVYINSLPSYLKSRNQYAEALLNGCDIEHILPRDWRQYSKWTNETHERDKNKIGNLIPLESSINRVIRNAVFKRKQEEYAKSLVLDAVNLSKKKPRSWFPQDVRDRQEKSNEQLMNFFKDKK